VFDLFAQERQSLDRSSGGLGLGLAIVKGFVKAHGGEVRASSPGRGMGSEFSFTLPLIVGDPAPGTIPKEEADKTVGAGRKVLVVDDNADAADTLVLALVAHGFEARQAADGPEALEKLSHFVPEVAIVDIGLPVMDGYELAARLKAREPSIRIIAVTGYGAEDEADSATQDRFEARLIKPVDMSSLLASIRGESRSSSSTG
jgi:CheY-like chemotaxis protein